MADLQLYNKILYASSLLCTKETCPIIYLPPKRSKLNNGALPLPTIRRELFRPVACLITNSTDNNLQIPTILLRISYNRHFDYINVHKPHLPMPVYLANCISY